MKPVKIVIYRDNKGEFRAQLWRGSRIVMNSGEGYKRRSSLGKSLSGLFDAIECRHVKVVDKTREVK